MESKKKVGSQSSKHMGNNNIETENLRLIQSQLEQNTSNSLIQETCLESKKLWHIAAPSIFTRLTMFSITVVSQSFAGHLNDLDLAAISIACTLLIAITFGFFVHTFSLYLLSIILPDFRLFRLCLYENNLSACAVVLEALNYVAHPNIALLFVYFVAWNGKCS